MIRKTSLYSMVLGDTGIIKVGMTYSDRIRERVTEHSRKFNVKISDIVIVANVEFSSRATVEKLEKQLIDNCIKAGLKMLENLQGDNKTTERFYINPTISEVSVTVRKKVYNIKVC